MILGTANFNNLYRDIYIPENECYKIIEKFIELGGNTIQTGYNYGGSIDIVNRYRDKINIIYKNENDILTLNNKIVGHSIYYPKQINHNDKIIIIPDCNIFENYLPIMKLHAKIYVRSCFTIAKYYHIKNRQYIDDYIIGVENIEQLIENMENFSDGKTRS